MAKAKQTPAVEATQTVKAKSLRDPAALAKLSIKLGLVRAKRVNR